jgi:tetratricopeptide (TPR) repeat protein
MMNWTRGIGWLEAIALVLVGIVIALVVAGQLDGVALIILLVIGYFGYMAQGVIAQAQRFRPVEPHATWLITMLANLALMALGIGAFGWYLAGGGAKTWIPFLVFIAGFIGLRQWRNGVVARLYAWRTPALTLLQKGDYHRLIRELEDDATAGAGHPDKLAMVALAYIELNKLDRAEQLLDRALSLAPDFASVNGALGSLRRHQARYADAVEAIRRALAFEDNVNSAYYLGLCQFLAGDHDGAQDTLATILDNPELIRQGQVYGAYILGQIAEQQGDTPAAESWYDRMQDGADKVIPALDEEARRHKQTAYGETLKEHVRAMRQIIKTRDGKNK